MLIAWLRKTIKISFFFCRVEFKITKIVGHQMFSVLLVYWKVLIDFTIILEIWKKKKNHEKIIKRKRWEKMEKQQWANADENQKQVKTLKLHIKKLREKYKTAINEETKKRKERENENISCRRTNEKQRVKTK